MFAEAQQKRQEDTVSASNFLYVRIQELEAALVAQRMSLEQSKHREVGLHRTIEGFAQLLDTKQRSIAGLEDRVRQLEHLEQAAQQRLRAVTQEVEALHYRQRAALAASSSSPSQGSPLRPTAGGDFPTSTIGASETHDALLNEVAQLRRQLDAKTHEANAAMIALNGLLDVRTRSASSSSSISNGGGGNATVLQEVAELVADAVMLRFKAEAECSLGSAVGLPAFLSSTSVAVGAPSSSASSGYHRQLLLERGGDVVARTQPASGGSSNSNPLHSTSYRLLARENLELKEQLVEVSTQPSSWSSPRR